MHIFCASHIDSVKRLVALKRMLEAWKEQTFHAPLYMSVSFAPDTDLDLRDDFHSFCDQHKDLWVYPTDEKLTQFQHYERLARLTTQWIPDSAWLAFTDDDDTWAPTRLQVFNNASEDADTEATVIKVVCGAKQRSFEYVDFTTRMGFFRGFFNRLQPIVLRSTFCDLVFRGHLNTNHNHVVSTNIELYNYKPNGTYKFASVQREILACCMGDELLLEDLPRYCATLGWVCPPVTNQAMEVAIETFYAQVRAEKRALSRRARVLTEYETQTVAKCIIVMS